MAQPGPAVGFLQLAVRFWDRWLKGTGPGLDGEPPLRVWMQESVPPAHTYAERPGRWIAAGAWPPPGLRSRRFALRAGRLDPLDEPDGAPAEAALSIRSPETVGLYAGRWCPHGLGPDLPIDQRFEDGGALTFDTAPLDERVEILGAPVVELHLAADRPVALVAVRLSDLAPDGAATRVSYGLLNLTHRHGHEHPTALIPGRRERARVQLNDVAQAVPPGHRIRVAVSTAYWPTAWPPPEPVTLTVFTGASTLELPVRPPDVADAALPPLPPHELPPALRVTTLETGQQTRAVRHDVGRGVATLDIVQDSGRYRFDDIDLTVRTVATERYDIRPDDPLSARAEVAWTVRLERGAWQVETHTRTVLTGGPDAWRLGATLDAFEAGHRVFCETWDRAIPRDLA
jgi:hypothetical protein